MTTFAFDPYNTALALLHQLRERSVMRDSELETAYSYMRFSELGPQARGDSIRRQTALRDAWLRDNPGVRLDETLHMRDEGVSAFRGDHRKRDCNAMAQFLAAIDDGRVRAGSYLVVENLDRLTRELPLDSLPWVLSLIRRGIRIVQLAPTRIVYDATMNEGTMIVMLLELTRGHAESVRKSTLIGPKWKEKKRLARDGVPIGKACPAWLVLENGAYQVKPGMKAAIQRLFQLSVSGLGYMSVARQLNRERVPCPVDGEPWKRGYICRLLHNRAVLGEYQPCNGSRSRQTDGEPIKGYYPSVISEKEWFAAQQALASRRNHCGRPQRENRTPNPFAGLFRNGIDGLRLYARRNRGHTYLNPKSAHQGTSEKPLVQFPLDSLTDALLSRLDELTAADLFNDNGADNLAVIEGRLADVRAKLTVAKERFDQDRGSAVWADMVTDYDQQARALAQQRELAIREASNPLSAAWSEAVQHMRRKDPLRLRQCLLATVDGVWCVFFRRGADRLAAVQVWFKGGTTRRDYVVWHRQRYGVDAQRNPPTVRVASPPKTIGVAYDLRNADEAKAVELALAELDLTRFGQD